MADVVAEIDVLGGSGLGALLQDVGTVQVDAPDGTTAPVVLGAAQGRSAALLPRHAAGHEHAPAQPDDRRCGPALDALRPVPALP